MNLAINSRVGLILGGFLLLQIEAGPFAIGEEPAPNDSGGVSQQATAEDDDSATAERLPTASNVPDWFIPESDFKDDIGMLYIRTDATCLNRIQAEEELKRECLRAVNKIVDEWFGESASEKMGLDAEFVFGMLLYKQRLEILPDNDPELAKLAQEQNMPKGLRYHVGYAQLHLNDQFRQFARERWLEVKTTKRLLAGGLMGGTLLALLVVSFGYLKLETATRGVYSRRLQTAFLVLAAIVLVSSVWLQRSGNWP